MELIHFEGLNCYYDCIVSMANKMGIPYINSFARLWSETDFQFDPERKVFLTRRMLEDLKLLGAKLVRNDCEKKEGSMIVGMDAFFLPWTPLFELGHGPHYFIAKKRKNGTWYCLDPTYQSEGNLITSGMMEAHAFDISCLKSVKKRQKNRINDAEEAERILWQHPGWANIFSYGILNSSKKEQEEAVLTAKYTDALLANRYLYTRYLRGKYGKDGPASLFDNAYFREWEVLKNGCFKLSLRRGDQKLTVEVNDRFQKLVEKERKIAKEILQIAR